MNHPRTADRTHVPELEAWAENQRPKAHNHRDARLYRYEATDLYQWWTVSPDWPRHQPRDEPFVIEGVRHAV